MTQESVWDREYKKSKLLTKDNKPQADVVRFVHYLNDLRLEIKDLNVLDLGSGTGRNSYYFAELGAKVTGFEISKTAIQIAKEYQQNELLKHPVTNIRYIVYLQKSIGNIFPIADSSVDIVLDVTSSNSLSEVEREVYLTERNKLKKDVG